MTVVFPKSEKRTQWEKTFNEVKQKITAALDYQPIPEFIGNNNDITGPIECNSSD